MKETESIQVSFCIKTRGICFTCYIMIGDYDLKLKLIARSKGTATLDVFYEIQLRTTSICFLQIDVTFLYCKDVSKICTFTGEPKFADIRCIKCN